MYASIIVIDAAAGSVNGYRYESNNMPSIQLSQIVSHPAYIGSFVAGTCTSTALVHAIFAGVFRTDSGQMTAMYIVPKNRRIVNTAELVNIIVLEPVGPDSFIAGGLELNDGAGMNAYVVRANAFYSSVKYAVRYRVATTYAYLRRVLSLAPTSTSAVKGSVRVDTVLYLVMDVLSTENSSLSNGITILKVGILDGAIQQQVHIVSTDHTLQCTNIVTTGAFLHITCYEGNSNSSRAVLICSDLMLTLSKLPSGYVRLENEVFVSERIALFGTLLPLTVREVESRTSDTTLIVGNSKPTQRPTCAPSSQPSSQPSTAPSGKPSISPTAAPSVSPQPTSQPSSSGPTNTYKPTVKPTQRPSIAQSVKPTQSPTARPTVSPTQRPTMQPSIKPSVQPSKTPTISPSRVPTNKPTRYVGEPLTRLPTAVPTVIDLSTASINSDQDATVNGILIGVCVIGGFIALWCMYGISKCCQDTSQSLAKQKKTRKELSQARLALAKQPPHGFRLPGRLEVYKKLHGNTLNLPAVDPILPIIVRRSKKSSLVSNKELLQNNSPVTCADTVYPESCHAATNFLIPDYAFGDGFNGRGAYAEGEFVGSRAGTVLDGAVANNVAATVRQILAHNTTPSDANSTAPVLSAPTSILHSSSSSSIVLSSLHSSEMSEVEYEVYSQTMEQEGSHINNNDISYFSSEEIENFVA